MLHIFPSILTKINFSTGVMSINALLPIPLVAIYFFVITFALISLALAVTTSIIGYSMVLRIPFPQFNKQVRLELKNGSH